MDNKRQHRIAEKVHKLHPEVTFVDFRLEQGEGGLSAYWAVVACIGSRTHWRYIGLSLQEVETRLDARLKRRGGSS